MKTITDYLKELPYPYNKLALANEDKEYYDYLSNADSKADALAFAFDWSESNQGWVFWSMVCDWCKDNSKPLPPLPENTVLEDEEKPLPEGLAPIWLEHPDRKEFAIRILQGLLANPAYGDYTTLVDSSIELADELIEKLNKKVV